jgi:hypothetical protein
MKHDGKWLEWLRWRLGLTSTVAKDSEEVSGGLTVFWRKDLDLSVKSMSKYHIDMVIKEENDFEWKEKTWDTLRTYASMRATSMKSFLLTRRREDR